jgi:hypothetical protein
MIINGFDAWLINVSMNLDIVSYIICLVSGMLTPMIALSPIVDDDIRKKLVIIGVAIFGASGFVQLIVPKPVVVEKYIISKYSVPEIMDKFDSYDAFYNQIGLEIREITGARKEKK